MHFYAGLDVSLETTSVCVVDGDGKIVRQAELASDPDTIEFFWRDEAQDLVGLRLLHNRKTNQPNQQRVLAEVESRVSRLLH